MTSINRRTFTKLAVAIGATAAWGDLFAEPSRIAYRERRESDNGGPLNYRARFRALLWEADKAPKLEVRIIEGDPKFSV
jgi:hypothetical protein